MLVVIHQPPRLVRASQHHNDIFPRPNHELLANGQLALLESHSCVLYLAANQVNIIFDFCAQQLAEIEPALANLTIFGPETNELS